MKNMDNPPTALLPPDPHVVIRPARPGDIPALRGLWPGRAEEAVRRLVLRAQQQALQGRGLGVVVIGEDGASPIGYAQVTLWRQTAEIADLAVAEAFRGQGLGTVLIQYLARVARQMRALRLEIGAALNNPRAVSLYRRLGFKDGKVVQLDLGQGVEPVLYLYLDLK